MLAGSNVRGGGSKQDLWAEGRVWMASWMSMKRIDQNPGRGSGNLILEGSPE
jgi:hypothetical protein